MDKTPVTNGAALLGFIIFYALSVWLLMLTAGALHFNVSFIETAAILASLRVLFVFIKGKFD